ncbi:MAG: hypothetical protein Ta2B_13120 [Termitinemataceae bacterium]|nr:MAG: hypothetical protein Ta2B_13120 [Termitinemataceae bacterium]
MTFDVKTEKSLKDWLSYQEQKGSTYCFSFFQITEKAKPDDSLLTLLQESILFSYRPKGFYNFRFKKTATAEEIRQYLNEQVLPDKKNQFDRNVRQGDWGEILVGLIVIYFQNLLIPINKLQWKFNKNKSVFGTDLIAFNNDDTIKDIYYYEIKTRLHPEKKEGENPDRQYLSVWAYKSLEKDANSPTESIANFLEMLYYVKDDYITAKKFTDIINNPQNYNKIYEIFLIVEKDRFDAVVLDALNDLPPQLPQLNVTIILIENLKGLIDKTWQDIENVIVSSIGEV